MTCPKSQPQREGPTFEAGDSRVFAQPPVADHQRLNLGVTLGLTCRFQARVGGADARVTP